MASRVPMLKMGARLCGGLQHVARDRGRLFYGRKEWLKLRAYKLARDPLCQRCKAGGRVVLAAHVHHVQDVAKRPELRLVYSNLESLCVSHHNAESARRGNFDRVMDRN